MAEAQKASASMEGFLTKKGGVSWKKRWFTLDDHVITYYSKQGDAKPRGRMVLNAESRVTNLPTRANAFQVITNNKALMVYADSGEEREAWFNTLNAQIEALKDRAAVRRARRNTRSVSCCFPADVITPSPAAMLHPWCTESCSC